MAENVEDLGEEGEESERKDGDECGGDLVQMPVHLSGLEIEVEAEEGKLEW